MTRRRHGPTTEGRSLYPDEGQTGSTEVAPGDHGGQRSALDGRYGIHVGSTRQSAEPQLARRGIVLVSVQPKKEAHLVLNFVQSIF